ncbi:hypothetical protein N0V90_001163 [Kalmusia sp. IMI 367209]|nr:hypothetical protein N0V90_001163 [Kalmusia sp. IMI 367209]
MKSFLSFVAGLAIFSDLAVGASIPRYLERDHVTRRQLSSNQVQKELGARVSNGTDIFGPDDSRFEEVTSRWNTYAVPQVQVVVEPAQESDVSTISTDKLKIKYCNENSIKFLAINRGHGNPTSLGTFNGIQINMVKLQNINIQAGGKTAWFQGGVFDAQVSDYLWEKGYVATTGSCDCVGLMGAGLGGGHGRHEGLYGMVSDNLVQLNVVLGNGKAIRVNSTSNSDLLWGMKGAGHNFGIVTSFEMNIYPRGPATWHYANYIWKGDKLDAVFKALNKLHNNGTTPVNMAINFGNFFMNTTISTTEPIISWTFAYRGSAQGAKPYLAPFEAIKAEYKEGGDVPYPEIAHMQQTGLNDFICSHGNVRITSTAGLQTYNLTAERQIFDGFKKRVVSNPTLAAGTGILHEGYSTEAVNKQDPRNSAYPFRDDHHLMLFDAIIAPGDKALETAAWQWANEVRDQWNAGQPGRPVNAYVNYANGKESLEERYGHEKWRIDRLKGLKKKYDPSNQFRYFNPIM